METKANTPSSILEQSNATINDKAKYLCTIECSIRRKANTTGLPGQDPAERSYRIGASLDGKTRTNLKGISGQLEARFMPEIIGVSPTDPTFRRSIEEYWSSINKPVPHDEPFLKEHERGARIKIAFHVIGKSRKERMDKLESVSTKIEYLNTLLTTSIKDLPTEYLASLEYEYLSDYLLLNYCLKYSKVANCFEDIDKSPKIDFYIFEKAISVKNQINLIELRGLAMSAYQTLSTDTNKINAILLMFKDNPNDYETETDKLLRIDERYNQLPIENMRNFVNFAKDDKWEVKYLINRSLNADKLRTLPNSTAIYYNDILLGMTIDDAVLYLDQDEKGKIIKESLMREIKI